MTEVSEKKIIEKVLGGDANAFEELVLKYEKTVYNLALRMVGGSRRCLRYDAGGVY